MFAESLYGSALEWFSRLEPNSVDSFAKLSPAFLKYYSMFVEDELTMADLWVRQKKNEPLKDFMVRYKEVLSKRSNVDPEFAMTTSKNGLWHESRFRLETTVNRPPTLEDAIHMATNYARAEEELASLAKQHMVKKKPHSNTWVRPGNGGNNP